MTDKNQKQIDKFKDAARELETDDDEARFNERIKKIAKSDPSKSAKDGKPDNTKGKGD